MGILGGLLGFSIWTGNAIHTSLQNARTKKEIQQIYKNAADTNFQNRAVAVLPNVDKQQLLLISSEPGDNDIIEITSKSATPAIDHIWGDNQNPEGTVVSGGKKEARVRALMPYVRKSQIENIPLIALHNGNRDLEAMIAQNSRYHEFISRNQYYYDVFRGMPVDDIAYLLYETMLDDDANPKAEALLRALLEVVLRKNSRITFQNLAAFPLADLKDVLDAMANNAEVTASEYKAIDRDYMAGSSELDVVRVFLNKLNRQAESVFGRPASNICNIKKMLNFKGAVAIDVGSVQNDMVVSLVMSHLILLQAQGRDFSILFDDIPISRFLKTTELLRGRTYAISHNDFFASLFGGERQGNDLFSEITGNIKTIILLRHTSGTTCQKWSEHLGKYHKIRIKYNISQNKAFMNSSDSRGISVDETDEPRVRAETLGRLPDNLACIHNSEGTLFAEV